MSKGLTQHTDINQRCPVLPFFWESMEIWHLRPSMWTKLPFPVVTAVFTTIHLCTPLSTDILPWKVFVCSHLLETRRGECNSDFLDSINHAVLSLHYYSATQVSVQARLSGCTFYFNGADETTNWTLIYPELWGLNILASLRFINIVGIL